MSKKSKIACIAIISAIALYTLAFAVCNQVFIKNVFDEVYYSEMHPVFLKFTGTSPRNLRGIISLNDRFSVDDGRGASYSTRGESDTQYFLRVSDSHMLGDFYLSIEVKETDYSIDYCYCYYISEKKVKCYMVPYTYTSSGKEVDREDDIDAFFEETGLSEGYIRTHQQLELDKFLDIWIEKNEGLSRFSSDDLGDFTVENVGLRRFMATG